MLSFFVERVEKSLMVWYNPKRGGNVIELTNQERVNLCFIFVSAIENLQYFLGVFNEKYNQIYRGQDDNLVTKQIRKIVNKKPDNINNKNQTLTNSDIQKILIELGFCDKEDIKKLNSMLKIRNEIAHEGFSIYGNKKGIEFFKLDELLPLYKRMIGKMIQAVLEKNPEFEKRLLKIYTLNIYYLEVIINDLLIDTKFEELKRILIKKDNS